MQRLGRCSHFEKKFELRNNLLEKLPLEALLRTKFIRMCYDIVEPKTTGSMEN
jgi:hypothetical protein